MELKYEIKDKSEITDDEYNQLDYLRFRDGFIWPALKKYSGFVVLCKEGDKIIGWSFTFKKTSAKKTFYLYIHKDFRRKGIGTKLYLISLLFNNNEQMTVSKWSNNSILFYKSVNR